MTLPSLRERIGDAPREARGFTLLELLVVLSIMALLIGILLPSLTLVRRRAVQIGCASNLRQVGIALEAYLGDFKDIYPVARFMPDPFAPASGDPSFNQTLSGQLPLDDSKATQVYRCPGDNDVFNLARMSYNYRVSLGGDPIDQYWLVRRMGLPTSKVWVLHDFDGGTFDLLPSGQVTVDFFHAERNFLFADSHVGLIQLN